MRFLAILILTIAIGCIEETLALKCYTCIAMGKDDPCFEGDTENMKSLECHESLKKCGVLHVSVNGVESTTRACSIDNACDAVPKDTECSLCDSDNCNSASGIVSSTFAMLIALLLKFYY